MVVTLDWLDFLFVYLFGDFGFFWLCIEPRRIDFKKQASKSGKIQSLSV